MKEKVFLLIAYTGAMLAASAQTVPAGMNYQGRLTTGNNTLVPDGSAYEVEVRLWTTAAGGTTPIWAARYGSVSVRNGAFNLILGGPGGAPLNGAISDLKTVFNTAPVTFLALTVTRDSNGTAVTSPAEILPRQQLFSSPYAMRAEQAGSVDADAITSAAVKDGEIKGNDIGTSEVKTANVAADAITGAKIASRSIANTHIVPSTIEADRLKLDYAKFVDEKPTNTNGGTYAQGWTKRALNKTESSVGASIALTGDSITLQPGVYWVCAQVPVYHSDIIAFLRKPDGTNLMRGTYAYGAGAGFEFSVIQGPLIITSADTVVEIWHYSPFRVTGPDRSFGMAANVTGFSERYTEISLLKIQ